MITFNVNLGERSYPIYITRDFSGLGKVCSDAGLTGKFVVITDSNVEKHYARACLAELSGIGKEVSIHTIMAGEKSKTLDTVAEIYKKLFSLRLDRNSTVVALGGGVVGDIAGFAAATYLRGINYVQLPTSLIAQADSSIGGKTGVDFNGGKNMIGAFYQPRLVYINVNTLRTLPVRELRSGLAEVIKHGLIADAVFYEYIDRNIDKIYQFSENVLINIARTNCSIKSGIVERDERESGLRAILNFGHTIGHAVESASDFSMLHGECVSIGIAGAFRLAVRLGMIGADETAKVESTLTKAGLPVRLNSICIRKIYENMMHDKKIRDDKLKFVLPRKIGEVFCHTVDDKALIEKVLEELN
ncbi:MAG: 3-dehydroquinate synthase [Acetivibrionales bacterium]|jgi:3-dehydroquinate synthase